MTIDRSGVADQLVVASGYQRPESDRAGIVGHGVAVVRGPDGEVKQRVEFKNLVTQQGEQNYGDAYAGLHANATVTDPPAVTGMQLGTGVTAAAKTGAGAAMVTYLAGSDKAIAAGFPTSALNTGLRRIVWQCLWAAGEATASGIAEATIVTRVLDAVVATTAQTVARALLSPVVNKGAADTLTITWNHDIGT